MPETVCYVLNSGNLGGGNLAALRLIDELDKTRYRPVAAAPNTGPLWNELQQRDVPVLPSDVLEITTAGGKWRLAKFLLQFRRWLAKQQVRILHAYDPLTYRLPAISSWGLRIRRICHIQLPPQPQTLPWAFRLPPDDVIACSRAIEQQVTDCLRGICKTTRVTTVPNFADVESYRPGPVKDALREEFRLERDALVVSIVGQVSQRKGHVDFLDLAARLLARRWDRPLRFLVAGEDLLHDGRFCEDVQRYARHLGIAEAVRFLGFREDVGDILRLTDVMVLPSKFEGLPLSIAESLACATPVVAYDIPGVNEIVLDGATGFLVRLGDVEALVQATARLLLDPDLRSQMGQAGRQLVETEFSQQAHAKGIQRIYAGSASR